MPIRSHLGRSLDVRHPFNVAVLGLMAAAAIAALVLWLNGSDWSLFLAPVHLFVVWALLREIDPEHNWSAIVGGVVAGSWVLVGLPMASALAIGGLILAGRLVTETTGRRPLPIDLAGTTSYGIAIGFTIEGWIAGFGLALALYLDDRLSGESRGMQVAAAAVTALGATVVATASRAFPLALPGILPQMAIPAGLIALLLVVRDPAEPMCRVDARHAALVRADRLHASRSLIGVLVFAMVLLVGSEADALVPLLFALLLAVVSNELERLRRRSQ
ncbi:MAG: hypothetical protein WAL25_12955 [Acidimicrobiia bacterium]